MNLANLIPKLLDSRGKQSITLTFVAVSWAVVQFKFFVGGMTLGPLGQMPVMDGVQFATATGAVLAIWLQREWTEKKHCQNKVAAGE